MNKKILMAILLTGLFAILTCLMIFKALNKRAPAAFPAELPAFEAITADGVPFHLDSIDSGKTVVVFYSPGCLFCEHEGKELARYAANFSDSRILFITCAPADSAFAYSLRTGIAVIPHYYALIDTTFQIPLLLGLRTTPTTLLYDEKRRLIKGFEGEVNAAKLLKTMQGDETEKK
jgi:thiol-disulfide isomerase/thioredoxin